MGHWLTIWTIRWSLMLFALAVAMTLWGLPTERRRRMWRVLWTVAASLFAVHVACAFHFYHHWSHASAVRVTGEQTRELLGWGFGEGIYFSYAFLAIWLMDATWSWIAPASYFHRPASLRIPTFLYLGFIAFNGAVVFESGPTRIGGAIATMLFAVLLWHRYRGFAGARPPFYRADTSHA